MTNRSSLDSFFQHISSEDIEIFIGMEKKDMTPMLAYPSVVT